VENARFAETNTSKSLLCALKKVHDCDVLWLNGDVVFDRRVLPLILRKRRSCMAVNCAQCGEEEIKYATAADGRIVAVSKQVHPGEGEAVGINLVRARDLSLFRDCLAACDDHDYFERGLELAVGQGMRLDPVDIGLYPCIEVDFQADLLRARALCQSAAKE
jgi:L-glutamine-phosphate cytidylyltransferase